MHLLDRLFEEGGWDCIKSWFTEEETDVHSVVRAVQELQEQQQEVDQDEFPQPYASGLKNPLKRTYFETLKSWKTTPPCMHAK